MIVLTGLNHKTAPLAVREKIFAGCQEKKDLLPGLLAVNGVEEVLYLSTCNRVEIIASVAEGSLALKELSGFMARNGNLTEAEANGCFLRISWRGSRAPYFPCGIES